MQQQARVKAIKGEAAKTVSRKARKSGRASGTASPAGSDALNRVFNQGDYRSENEATPPGTPGDLGYDSDDDDYGFRSGMSTPGEHPAFEPRKLASEIQDHRNNTSDIREYLLRHYVHMCTSRYNGETAEGATNDLTKAFIKGAKRGDTPNERKLSVEAAYLTLLINAPEGSGASHIDDFKTLASEDGDDEDLKVKVLTALTICVCHFSTEDSITDYLDFLVEAITSNGESIHAIDQDDVMVKLCQCWGYAASQIDMFPVADYAMEAFVDKLDSSDTETVLSAAECICLIFEESRAHEDAEGKPFDLPYDPARISTRISHLQKDVLSYRSKRDRRDIRAGLSSAITSLDEGKGPYYSKAIRPNGTVVGYRENIRKDGGSSSLGYKAPIETWEALHRINFLRSALRGGLSRHLLHETETVYEMLKDLDWNMVLKTDSKKEPKEMLRGSSSRGYEDGFGDEDE